MDINNRLLLFIISLILSMSGYAQNTCVSNGTGGGEWGDATTWNCTGGSNFPDLSVSTVNIQDGDVVTLTNTIEGGFNYDFLTPQDTLEATVNLAGDLVFDGLGAGLILTDDSQIIFSNSGDLISDGAFIDVVIIGDNVVWNGQEDGDVPGPGVMDENTEAGALPVDLMYFKVEEKENTDVEITWSTVTEENNDYFNIERSGDGLTYEVIATIAGAGNSTDILTYQYHDNNPLFGMSYYRLKQTDYDGVNETFNAQSVYISSLDEVVVYPNPVKSGEQLNLYSSAEKDEDVSYSIYSSSGAVIIMDKLTAGNNQLVLNSDMKPGFYMIKIKSGEKQIIQRLLVK